MCLCVVWSVSVCYHLPCKCLSLSFHVRTCSLSTHAVFGCDGSINVFNILWKLEWQWKCVLFQFKAYFARLGVGLLKLDRRVRSATCKRWWFTFCAKSVCFAFHMFSCVHQGVLQFAHIIDVIEESGGNAWDCAHLHGVCVRSYMSVRQSGVFYILFHFPKVLRHISNCFKWARQMQRIEMYVIAMSSVVDKWDELDWLNLWIVPCWQVSTSARAFYWAVLCCCFLIRKSTAARKISTCCVWTRCDSTWNLCQQVLTIECDLHVRK